MAQRVKGIAHPHSAVLLRPYHFSMKVEDCMTEWSPLSLPLDRVWPWRSAFGTSRLGPLGAIPMAQQQLHWYNSFSIWGGEEGGFSLIHLHVPSLFLPLFFWVHWYIGARFQGVQEGCSGRKEAGLWPYSSVTSLMLLRIQAKILVSHKLWWPWADCHIDY